MPDNNENIAVATDNLKCRILLQQALERCSENIFFADTCDKLKEFFNESTKITAVLIEASFCDSDWKTIADKLKKTENSRNIPVVLFSHSENLSEKKSHEPADSFLKLPFSADSFISTVTNIRQMKNSENKTILLVDDSTFIHKMVETSLSGEKISMLHAYNGEEGIEKAEKYMPDLIITDIEMPVKNGYELCSILKNTPVTHDIPIIIQSSLSSGYNFDKGFDVGADDYITKPLVSEELISRINDFLFRPEEKRETVIVADSSRMIRKMVILGLEKQGFNTLEAESGEEIFNILKEKSVDLFIVSQIFREISGRDIVRKLRKKPEYRSNPVIMLSSRESTLDSRKNRSAGINDFISKPFSIDRLLVSVEKNLAEYRVKKEKEALGLYISDAARINAEKIARSNTKLEMGAKKEFKTILFTDIVGFTPVCEKLPPENVVSVLNEYFDNIVQIINRNCGTIDKFIGDAVMAYFGGMENGALMAVNSALEMLEYLKTTENSICRKIKIRIGINSGDVISGDIGSRFSRRDFTLIGDNVNIAQRLESAAPPNSILISDSTYSLIKENIEAREVPPVKLKGKNRVVKSYIAESIKNLAR